MQTSTSAGQAVGLVCVIGGRPGEGRGLAEEDPHHPPQGVAEGHPDGEVVAAVVIEVADARDVRAEVGA
jgi:hypothetical protein